MKANGARMVLNAIRQARMDRLSLNGLEMV